MISASATKHPDTAGETATEDSQCLLIITIMQPYVPYLLYMIVSTLHVYPNIPLSHHLITCERGHLLSASLPWPKPDCWRYPAAASSQFSAESTPSPAEGREKKPVHSYLACSSQPALLLRRPPLLDPTVTIGPVRVLRILICLVNVVLCVVFFQRRLGTAK